MYSKTTAMQAVCAGCALTLAPCAAAEQEVIEGSLSGGAAPTTQEFQVSQFDTKGGTRDLNFVLFEASTIVTGGYQTDASGTVVDFLASLTADYSLGRTVLAETEAVILGSVPSIGFIAVSLFDADDDSTVIESEADLEPWIGDGDVTLAAFTEFIVTQSPEGVIGFGAGGSVNYTVTYDYDVVGPNPADIDGDGIVGPADLAILLGAWGKCGHPGKCLATDLDGDLVIGPADLAILLGAWG